MTIGEFFIRAALCQMTADNAENIITDFIVISPGEAV
jgi:hypothetical protein